MEKRKVAAVVVVLLVVVAIGLLAWVFRPRPGYYADIPALMVERYGRYDAEQKVWGVPETGRFHPGDVVFTICARETVRSGATEKILLAACGRLPESPSHADAGRVDFFVLEKEGEELHLLALSEYNDSGSFGEPGRVAIIRLGKAFWGFRVDDGWTGQGYVLNATRIFVPSRHGIEEALALRTGIDNSGSMACDEEPAACTSLERKLVVFDGQPGAMTWPLVVTESGYRDGKNVYAVYEIDFDKRTWTYVYPESIGLADE
ncbi:MAG: hypothetical protein K0S16_2027 [Moraxellaceae bacterium]|jgi:hypothetical protein|nr:hypothetical protein [Moraxellaceae bacterium]